MWRARPTRSSGLDLRQGAESSRTRDRVATEGGAETPGMDGVHDVGPSRDTTDGEAATETLCRRDQVGDDPEMLAGEHLARPGHAGLHLVGDEDDPVLLAVLRQAGKKTFAGMITPPSPCTGSTSTQAMRLPADLLVHRRDRQIRAGLAASLGCSLRRRNGRGS